MGIPVYLWPLYERFQRLQTLSASALTADQTRSLRFFRADFREHPRERIGERVTAWVTTAHKVDAHVVEHGQIPRRTRVMTQVPAESRRIVFWLEDQRRPSTRARQCEYQKLRIAAFPGLDPRSRDARWQGTYRLYAAYLREHGHVPAARSHDALERSLSLWATRQRYEYRRGTLPAWRGAALTMLPMWSFGPQARRD